MRKYIYYGRTTAQLQNTDENTKNRVLKSVHFLNNYKKKLSRIERKFTVLENWDKKKTVKLHGNTIRINTLKLLRKILKITIEYKTLFIYLENAVVRVQ